MIRCPKCETPAPTDARTCSSCGAGLTIAGAWDTLPYPASDPRATQPQTPPGAFRPPPEPELSEPDGTVHPFANTVSSRTEQLLSHIERLSHFKERYELKARLDEGGMGQIWRAYDLVLRREVAVKVLRDTSGMPQKKALALRGQFVKEARIASGLFHPNVLNVQDIGATGDGRLYYTMRLVDGGSLQMCLDALDKGVETRFVSYPLRRVVEAFARVCHGVDYAHQRGVMHLDLKPRNVLVSGFHEVFVIDWGLARLSAIDETDRLADIYEDEDAPDAQADLTSTGVFGGRAVGTPAYLAPEQVSPVYGSYGPRTDVYGLGGILHFVLYGAPPNRGASAEEAVASATRPKERSALRAGLRPRGQRVPREQVAACEHLEELCMKALRVRPDERYATTEELIVELGDWIAAAPAAGF